MTTTLYRNGRVLTMDAAGHVTDAVLVVDGRFSAVGDAARSVEGASKVVVVDLEGRTVVPGLIDAHTHLESSAVSSNHWIDIRGVDHASALERLAAAVTRSGPGVWVVGQAVMGQPIPGRAELDRIAPDSPLLIRGSMHFQTANTMALQRAGLLDSRFTPVGVEVERHPGGEPTGAVKEGYHLFPIPSPPPEELATFLADEINDRFNRYGVTSIYEVPMTSEGMRAFSLLDRQDRLTARISLNPAIQPGLQPLVGDIAHWASMGLTTGFGNERLWLGAAKLFLDGALDVAFDIERDRQHPRRWGATTHQFNELVRTLVIAYEASIQLWIHAIGPDAQYLALDAVAEAQQTVGGDLGLRTRIEHMFAGEMTEELLVRTKEVNAIPVPNAPYLHIDATNGLHPYRTLIEQGFMPPGNSDTAGSAPIFQNPWFGISKMVGRRNARGVQVVPEEAISVYDAIRTYTEFAAHAAFQEGRTGVIAPGAHADLAVLTADPMQVPEDELDGIESVLTVLGGEPVWDRR
jgi:predicted amidohydrolase YtcJ